MASILVINPNSSPSVTRSMEACLGIVKEKTPYTVTCIELPQSPPGIETDEDVATVIPYLLEAVATHKAFDAYVIACFSDPGLAEIRAVTDKPVIGIAEAAYIAAIGLGNRFGIVSLGQSSIARHLSYLQHLRLDGRMAGDRSIDKTIPQLMASNVVETVARTGRQLVQDDGADVVILGCAGLGSYRIAMQDALGLPVVDPVQAGVALACTTLDLNYRIKARS